MRQAVSVQRRHVLFVGVAEQLHALCDASQLGLEAQPLAFALRQRPSEHQAHVAGDAALGVGAQQQRQVLAHVARAEIKQIRRRNVQRLAELGKLLGRGGAG